MTSTSSSRARGPAGAWYFVSRSPSMTPNENAAARVPPPEKARITKRSLVLLSSESLSNRYPLLPSNAGSLPLMGWPVQATRTAAPTRRSDRAVARIADLLREGDVLRQNGRGAVDVDELARGVEILRAAKREGVFPCVHSEDPMAAAVVQVVPLTHAAHEDLAPLGEVDDHVFHNRLLCPRVVARRGQNYNLPGAAPQANPGFSDRGRR